MQLANTQRRYGAITKTFHWLTALLILSAIPLGFVANDIAYAIKNPDVVTTDADLTRVVLLFSLHKTIGVAAFFVALGRIAWAISQPKPGLLNGDKPLEAFAAELVHWMLYVSMVMAPLSGWIHHAATTGFAPIWWPFGQSLPFVPKDDTVADLFAGLHLVFVWSLVGSLVLHIAGALKHHLVDRDATLRRMLPGFVDVAPAARQPGHRTAFIGAIALWIAILGGGAAAGLYSHETVTKVAVAPETKLAPTAPSGSATTWAVTDGSLGISVLQAGSQVEGQFSDWTAAISFDDTPDETGIYGSVRVDVVISSLTLGSVSSQAKGSDYLAADAHPKALFDAKIVKSDNGYVAQGELTIKDNSVPVTLPFNLAIDGDIATADGALDVDRRDFGVGGTDEGTVGATVLIDFALMAKRQNAIPAENTELAALAPQQDTATDAGTASASEGSAWQVTQGSLGIDVNQLGSNVRGVFEDWSAEINYSDMANEAGNHGSVKVDIPISALRLGSVTAQAMGADYFDVGNHPVAAYSGTIHKTDTGHELDGTLTIKGVAVALKIPFDLSIDGDMASATGKASVDRRDFGIGSSDETNVKAIVSIDFQLDAQRQD